MKIAISVSSQELSDPIETRFGRAPSFVIYDTETKDSCFIENSPNAALAQGAGMQTAHLLIKKGVSAVITGQCGPKAIQALQANGISIYCSESITVSAAIDQFDKGELECMA